jgi:hypothetical protein
LEDNVFQNGNQSLPKVSGSEVKGREYIYNYDEAETEKGDKKSPDFSELKKTLGVPEKPVPGMSTEHQVEGIRIGKALGAKPERYSAFIKACKEEPRWMIMESYAYAVDITKTEVRDKSFFKRLHELKEGGKREKSEASVTGQNI